MTSRHLADVAELADAQVSEACDGDIVEVQVLSSAPRSSYYRPSAGAGSNQMLRHFDPATALFSLHNS